MRILVCLEKKKKNDRSDTFNLQTESDGLDSHHKIILYKPLIFWARSFYWKIRNPCSPQQSR